MGGRRVRCVVFDLDDTLVPTTVLDAAAIEAAARTATADAAERARCAAAFGALLRESPFPPSAATSLGEWREDLWRRALSPGTPAHLVQQAHAKWLEERLAHFCFEADVDDMLRRLRRRYTLCLVTNGHADAQRPKLAACRADRFFKGRILIGGLEPEPKPAKAIFDKILAIADAAPEESVMVGDNLVADVQGATNAGFKATIWLKPPGAQPSPLPSHTIANILQLERVLDELDEDAAPAEDA